MKPKTEQAVGTLDVQTVADRELRMERVFNASRERVWRALTDPSLVARWWGRGNRLVVERMVVERGGHWRYLEHAPSGPQGFEGRYREVMPPERLVSTFEWDGRPGHVVVNTTTLEDMGDGCTRLVTVSLFETTGDRDGMVRSGMEEGANASYDALDRVLLTPEDAGSAPDAPACAPLGIRRVAFTMHPVVDVARARAFYEHTLGLRPSMVGEHGNVHWIEYTLPDGGCLAISNASADQPSATAGATLALEVDDLAALMQHLKAHDVPFKTEVIPGPSCKMAVCVDPEGNSILLHQLDHAEVQGSGC
jgi:uncharacterized protein YndB with AHSA1/START domain/predicted enzyme related to lactoylglutathione lyase